MAASLVPDPSNYINSRSEAVMSEECNDVHSFDQPCQSTVTKLMAREDFSASSNSLVQLGQPDYVNRNIVHGHLQGAACYFRS